MKLKLVPANKMVVAKPAPSTGSATDIRNRVDNMTGSRNQPYNQVGGMNKPQDSIFSQVARTAVAGMFGDNLKNPMNKGTENLTPGQQAQVYDMMVDINDMEPIMIPPFITQGMDILTLLDTRVYHDPAAWVPNYGNWASRQNYSWATLTSGNTLYADNNVNGCAQVFGWLFLIQRVDLLQQGLFNITYKTGPDRLAVNFTNIYTANFSVQNNQGYIFVPAISPSYQFDTSNIAQPALPGINAGNGLGANISRASNEYTTNMSPFIWDGNRPAIDVTGTNVIIQAVAVPKLGAASFLMTKAIAGDNPQFFFDAVLNSFSVLPGKG